jgi:predicted PurR-regulated permease PerM
MNTILQGNNGIDETGQTVLIIVGCIALFVLLFTLVYMIIAFRKIGIVAKKLDYLVEDLTYKSEMLTPTVEALTKVSNYIDLFESIINQNADALINYINKNKSSTTKFISKLKDIAAKGK